MNVLTLLMSFMASVKNGAAATGVPVEVPFSCTDAIAELINLQKKNA
jgi:hypothetical protein